MLHNNNTVFVTDSSSGIGLDIVDAFIGRGANGVLTGHDAAQLDCIASDLSGFGFT